MQRTLLSLAVTLAGFVSALNAEPSPGEVEVSGVRFKLARPSVGAQAEWLEADVELEARPTPAHPARMLSRVRIILVLRFEVGSAEGVVRTECFRASAEAVALSSGRSHVRFYLPPEILRRDAARGEPRYWRAEAVVDGHVQPAGRARFSSSLSTSEARRNFVEVSDGEAAVNDGILLPQYLTPFAGDHPATTPNFVRREMGG